MNFDENCFYCAKGENLDSQMIKICDLEVSTVYLFKEQTLFECYSDTIT